MRDELFLLGTAALKPGARGAFEIIVDGVLLFSKLELDRFPNDGEIIQLLKG